MTYDDDVTYREPCIILEEKILVWSIKICLLKGICVFTIFFTLLLNNGFHTVQNVIDILRKVAQYH